MSKLLSIVLAILVLVLVLLFTTETYRPIRENFVAAFDSVLIWMNLNQDHFTGTCKNYPLVSYFPEESSELLKVLEVPREFRQNINYFVCEDGGCGLNLTEDFEVDHRTGFSLNSITYASSISYIEPYLNDVPEFKKYKDIYYALRDRFNELMKEYEKEAGKEYNLDDLHYSLYSGDHVVIYIGVLEEEGGDDKTGYFYKWDSGKWSYKKGRIDDYEPYTDKSWDNTGAFNEIKGVSLRIYGEVNYWLKPVGRGSPIDSENYKHVLGSDRRFQGKEMGEFTAWFNDLVDELNGKIKDSKDFRKGFADFVYGKTVNIRGKEKELVFDPDEAIFYYLDDDHAIGISPLSRDNFGSSFYNSLVRYDSSLGDDLAENAKETEGENVVGDGGLEPVSSGLDVEADYYPALLDPSSVAPVEINQEDFDETLVEMLRDSGIDPDSNWIRIVDLGRFMDDFDTLLKLIKIYDFLNKKCV